MSKPIRALYGDNFIYYIATKMKFLTILTLFTFLTTSAKATEIKDKELICIETLPFPAFAEFYGLKFKNQVLEFFYTHSESDSIHKFDVVDYHIRNQKILFSGSKDGEVFKKFELDRRNLYLYYKNPEGKDFYDFITCLEVTDVQSEIKIRLDEYIREITKNNKI